MSEEECYLGGIGARKDSKKAWKIFVQSCKIGMAAFNIG